MDKQVLGDFADNLNKLIAEIASVPGNVIVTEWKVKLAKSLSYMAGWLMAQDDETLNEFERPVPMPTGWKNKVVPLEEFIDVMCEKE